ncbi:MAG: transcriptional activator NhaR [Lysobacterales bacterium]|jgi:LysR family transcriptional activator of nhaA
MRHLNYNHLLYFHTVAREGSVAKAAEILHLTPQTISGQIKLLEESVGAPLFERAGRGLALTQTGHTVNTYAEAIFALGGELALWAGGNHGEATGRLSVGIVNSIPKLVAYRVLRTGLEGNQPLRLVCQESELQSLLADLSVHRLDLVLSDRPIPMGFNVKAFNHLLGESPISFYGLEKLANRFIPEFPASLDGAPMLLPVAGSALRRGLDAWFEEVGVAPNIVAEFDDSALLKAFGEAGAGIFPAPSFIDRELRRTYHVLPIGPVERVRETYYAISPERIVRNPAVRRITDVARERLSQPE